MFQQIASFTKRRTFINVSALFTASSLARVFSALSIFILARQLGVNSFGQYTASISLAKLTAVFFSLGLDNWLLRSANHQKERLPTIFGTNLAIKFFGGSVWLIGLTAVAPLLRQDVTPTFLVFLSGTAVWLEELTNSTWSLFKATLNNRIVVRLMVGTQSALLLMIAILSMISVKDAHQYLIGRILVFVLANLISMFFAIRLFGIQFEKGQIIPTLKETAPFSLSQGLALVYGRADITIIAYKLGKAAAGLYAPAVSLMTTLFLIPTSIYEVMLPILSEMNSTDPHSVRHKGFHLFALSAGLGALLGVGLSILSFPLIYLFFGEEFLGAGSVLIILSGVLVFKCASFALAALLASVGLQHKRVVVQALTAIFNVAVNLIVVQKYRIHGVAYVYVITEFLLMAGYLYMWLQWKPSPKNS